MDDTMEKIEATKESDLVLKKYTSKVGIKKVHKMLLKKQKNKKKVKSKKQNKNDIIPINKTKKRKLLVGGEDKNDKGKAVATPIELKHGLPHPLQMTPEYLSEQNMKQGFGKLSKMKKSEYKRMIFKKQSPEGQLTYLEYLYYLLMGLHQKVYSHIKPSNKEGALKEKIYKNMIGIFQNSTTAFNIHMPNGIQVADFSTLSTGTNKETYYDIVYSLSMMRRNTRDVFLSKCDKVLIRFLKKSIKEGSAEIKKGIKNLFKLSKAIVQVASFVKTKSGLTNIKNLYQEVFNGNSLLPQAAIAMKKHKNKLKFICALFRFRRDQLQYNYFLDKFIVRLRMLFNTPDAQLAVLSGNHRLLYGNDQSKLNLYSINAITMNCDLTNLSKFRSNLDMQNMKTDTIAKEIQSKLDAFATELRMGNYHKLYEVIGDNDKIYYEYKNDGGKDVKVLKDIFRYQSGDAKKVEMAQDAQYIAHAYRIYHMLYHLYPNVARIMNTQDEWLKIYGLPKFDELSYHRKKFKALRKKKNYESDYYRFAQGLNTISADLNQDITQLMNYIDSAVTVESSADTDEIRKYRYIIAYLDNMYKKLNDMSEGEIKTIQSFFITKPPQIPQDGSTLSNLSFEGGMISEITSAYNNIKSSPTRTVIQTYIKKLMEYYQAKLKEVSGMTRKLEGTIDDKKKLLKALDIPEFMAGGADEIHEVEEDEPKWDGTDDSLDLIQEYGRQQNMKNNMQSQYGGSNKVPKTVITTDGQKTLYYYNFSEADLKGYWRIVVDFVNSPHFIGSGGKLEKFFHKISLSGKDTGTDKGIGQESLFMELNYFSYLVKIEMGVLNYDEDLADANIPLGTNLSRVACGIPLFYETYLVNHFTNIFDTSYIEKNNYSRIGYILAGVDKNKTINKLLFNTNQVLVYTNTNNPAKCDILKKQFGDSSIANTSDSARKIPFTLLELASMTPEELLSLSSLASNAELNKILNTKVENVMNQKLSSNKYLKPLEKFISDLYGSDYFFGHHINSIMIKRNGLQSLINKAQSIYSTNNEGEILHINFQIAEYILKRYITLDQSEKILNYTEDEIVQYIDSQDNLSMKKVINILYNRRYFKKKLLRKQYTSKQEEYPYKYANPMFDNTDVDYFYDMDRGYHQYDEAKYPNLFDSNNASDLKDLTTLFRFILYSTKWQDKTKSKVSQLFNVLSKTLGISLLAALTGGPGLMIPVALYIPWVLSDIYKYNTFDSAWDAFIENISKDVGSGFTWSNFTQILGNTWSTKGARRIWGKLNKDEQEFIKQEAQGLYNVYRESKMNMFYTSMVKDEVPDATNIHVTPETILQNLIYMGIISAKYTKKSRTHITIPALPFFSGSANIYTKYSKTLSMCSYVLTKYITSDANKDDSVSAVVKFAAEFLFWQFSLDSVDKKYYNVIYELKDNNDTERTNVVRNIFTDSNTDEYGAKIFEELGTRETDVTTLFYNYGKANKDIQIEERQSMQNLAKGAKKPIAISSIIDQQTVNKMIEGSTRDFKTAPKLAAQAEAQRQQNQTQSAGGPIGLVGKAVYSIADMLSLPEIFGTMWDYAKSIPENLGIFFNTSSAERNKFIETMNLILGLHKYVEAIKIFGDNLAYVDESIKRTQNLFSRSTSETTAVETIDKSLVKTNNSDFATLLLNGSFNGLLTSSIRMIGEDGLINLIQYYRNQIMDIMNTEQTLQIPTGSKETVRIKFNKVLTKLLVFLRLNAIFTDYLLMNKDILHSSVAVGTISNQYEFLSLLGYDEGSQTYSRRESEESIKSVKEEHDPFGYSNPMYGTLPFQERGRRSFEFSDNPMAIKEEEQERHLQQNPVYGITTHLQQQPHHQAIRTMQQGTTQLFLYKFEYTLGAGETNNNKRDTIQHHLITKEHYDSRKKQPFTYTLYKSNTNTVLKPGDIIYNASRAPLYTKFKICNKDYGLIQSEKINITLPELGYYLVMDGNPNLDCNIQVHRYIFDDCNTLPRTKDESAKLYLNFDEKSPLVLYTNDTTYRRTYLKNKTSTIATVHQMQPATPYLEPTREMAAALFKGTSPQQQNPPTAIYEEPITPFDINSIPDITVDIYKQSAEPGVKKLLKGTANIKDVLVKHYKAQTQLSNLFQPDIWNNFKQQMAILYNNWKKYVISLDSITNPIEYFQGDFALSINRVVSVLFPTNISLDKLIFRSGLNTKFNPNTNETYIITPSQYKFTHFFIDDNNKKKLAFVALETINNLFYVFFLNMVGIKLEKLDFLSTSNHEIKKYVIYYLSKLTTTKFEKIQFYKENGKGENKYFLDGIDGAITDELGLKDDIFNLGIIDTKNTLKKWEGILGGSLKKTKKKLVKSNNQTKRTKMTKTVN